MGNPLLPYLRELERPGRYLGGEINTIVKENHHKLLRFVLLYPETYEIGMSNLGLRILYHILNMDPRVQAERAYLPYPDALEVMEREKIPLFTYETYTPLKRADVIGISLQTDLNDTSVLKALELSQIPLIAEERKEDDPIVIGGGPVTHNPLPLSKFFDAFVIGEGEEVVIEMLDPLLEFKRGAIRRMELLEELSKIQGIFVPHMGKKRVKRRFADLKEKYFPINPIVPSIEIIHDRLTIEVMRGCTRGCRFCQAGYIYRPIRIRDPHEILELSKRALINTGWDELGLLAFTVSDYPDLEGLIRYLRSNLKDTFISLPSLPIDALSEEFLKTMKGLRRFGLTLAPETPSQKLRDVINKNVPFELVYKSIELAEKYGWRHIKLYFMIGLPEEDVEDVREIARFLRELHAMSRKVVFKASINTFIPKPHTPFERERQLSVEEVEELLRILAEETKSLRRVNLKWRDPRKSAIEGILGRGDERLSDVILEVYRMGAYLEDRSEFFNFDRWKRALEERGLTFEEFLGERKEELPWEFIDTGIYRRFLERERQKSKERKVTGNCMEVGCRGCGPWFKDKYPTCLYGLKIKRVTAISMQQEDTQASLSFIYAFRLRKEKDMVYLGHNDFVRVVLRAMRRAGFPIKYTMGFVPRPKMSFGPSLPLGVESDAEWVVVELKERLDKGMLYKFKRELPQGIEILEYGELVEKPRWGLVTGARYSVHVKEMDREIEFDLPFGDKKSVFMRVEEILNIKKEEARKLKIRRLALISKDGSIFDPLIMGGIKKPSFL